MSQRFIRCPHCRMPHDESETVCLTTGLAIERRRSVLPPFSSSWPPPTPRVSSTPPAPRVSSTPPSSGGENELLRGVIPPLPPLPVLPAAPACPELPDPAMPAPPSVQVGPHETILQLMSVLRVWHPSGYCSMQSGHWLSENPKAAM